MSDHLIHADVLDWLRANQWQAQNGYLPKYHAVLCDPPYFLGSITKRFGKAGSTPAQYGRDGAFRRASAGFMGKQWDGFDSVWQYQDWVTEWASLLLDFVYPGALLMAFGGTRTYHRLASGLEDAGWDVIDSMHYLYGTGFPKSHDISKAIDKAAGAEQVIGYKPDRWTQKGGTYNFSTDRPQEHVKVTAPATAEAQAWEGYGTALKPAFEPVVIARAPRGSATYAQLAQQYGTGAFNIEGSRIGTEQRLVRPSVTRHDNNVYGKGLGAGVQIEPTGRWPANILLDKAAAALLDAQSGETKSKYRPPSSRPRNNGVGLGISQTRAGASSAPDNYGDAGGASRFFFTAKASSFEREAGLADMPLQIAGGMSATRDQSMLTGSGNVRNNHRRNTHPTVKPLRLNEYLARLLLPPASVGERRLLIPFAGVASEMIGAHLAGWDVVTGLEREAEYIEQGRARLQWWTQFDSYEEAKAAHDKARKQRKQPAKDDEAQEYQQQDMFEAQQQGAD